MEDCYVHFTTANGEAIVNLKKGVELHGNNIKVGENTYELNTNNYSFKVGENMYELPASDPQKFFNSLVNHMETRCKSQITYKPTLFYPRTHTNTYTYTKVSESE